MPLQRTIRSVFFWIHLSVGLLAGGLILLMSITGVMLGFERQMIAWIDGVPRVEASAAAPMPLDALVATLGIPRADVASIIVKRDPTQPVALRLRERGAATVYAHPVTGARLLPSGDGSGQRFFSALRRWHRWVGAQGGELRAQMKVLNGTANLMFLGLVLSGIYLWWPRRWTRARLRATMLPQVQHRAGQARDYNWHNSLGFWFAIPLAIIIATGAFFSFRWPGQYLDIALGSERERAAARAAIAEARVQAAAPAAPTARASAESSERQESESVALAPEASLAAFVTTAAATHPKWTQLTLTLPNEDGTTLRVVAAEGNTYRPDQRYTLELNRETASLASAAGYADLSPARKIRAWVRYGHTGEVFGIPGQILATLASSVGVLLVWTGFALAWRRLRQALRRRRRSVPAVGALPDAALESPASLR